MYLSHLIFRLLILVTSLISQLFDLFLIFSSVRPRDLLSQLDYLPSHGYSSQPLGVAASDKDPESTADNASTSRFAYRQSRHRRSRSALSSCRAVSSNCYSIKC
ncbi:hypothetical protein V8C40DRAFT_242471 [Trichoderma camerunense]